MRWPEDINALALTCRLCWTLGIVHRFAHATIYTLLPRLIKDRHDDGTPPVVSQPVPFSTSHASRRPLQCVSSDIWDLFHERAAAVRFLTVDFDSEIPRLPYLLRSYLLHAPSHPLGSSNSLFPHVKDLRITFDARDVAMLPRFLSPSLESLQMTFLEPFPSSSDMNAILGEDTVLSNLGHVSITFNHRHPPFGQRSWVRSRTEPPHGIEVEVAWIVDFLRRLCMRSSLKTLCLEGCVVTSDVYDCMRAMTQLECIGACSRPDSSLAVTERPSMREVLSSMPPSTLRQARLRVLTTESPFDLAVLSPFVELTSLEMRFDGSATPHNFISLSALTRLRCLSIRSAGLVDEITPPVFRTLVKGWTYLEELLLANEGWSTNASPAIHLQDLALLGECCPLLHYLWLAFDTRCSTPLPTPSRPLASSMTLNFRDTRLTKQDARYALPFIGGLFPRIDWLHRGMDDGWEPLHTDHLARQLHKRHLENEDMRERMRFIDIRRAKWRKGQNGGVGI